MRCGIYVRVSTDDQRDNGYSIDSQLRMIKEYCEKNEYNIVDIYNDAGHSGKDLMRPEMQRLLKDIKSKKIDKLVAIKVDRLTRNNYDGFWLLNYCEEHDVKIELILEPYDVSTANGEMIFGMNLVFGQRERKEIGARTKRAMEEMALERIHPSKAPYGYIRNKETGHLEVEPIEAEVVKEIFELCKQGNSTRGIATIMKDNNAYLKQEKWKSDRVYKIRSTAYRQHRYHQLQKLRRRQLPQKIARIHPGKKTYLPPRPKYRERHRPRHRTHLRTHQLETVPQRIGLHPALIDFHLRKFARNRIQYPQGRRIHPHPHPRPQPSPPAPALRLEHHTPLQQSLHRPTAQSSFTTFFPLFFFLHFRILFLKNTKKLSKKKHKT